jgi:hypothetical protein
MTTYAKTQSLKQRRTRSNPDPKIRRLLSVANKLCLP